MVLASKTWQDEPKSATTTNTANLLNATAAVTTTPLTQAGASTAIIVPTTTVAQAGGSAAQTVAASVASSIGGGAVAEDNNAGEKHQQLTPSSGSLDSSTDSNSSVTDSSSFELEAAKSCIFDNANNVQVCKSELDDDEDLTTNNSTTSKSTTDEDESCQYNNNATITQTNTNCNAGELVTKGQENMANSNANYIKEGQSALSNPTGNPQYSLQPSVIRSFRANPVSQQDQQPQEPTGNNSISAEELNSALKRVMNSEPLVANGGGSSGTALASNLLKTKLPNNFLNALGLAPPVVNEQPSVELMQNGTGNRGASSSYSNANSNNDLAGSCTDESFDSNGPARIILSCESNSHPFQIRSIQLTPNVECKVGRLIARSKACETNAIFDCKVLSRNHAVLWYSGDDRKFWVKDTKSSNGTFINDVKLGNDPAELHFGDIVKFGVDVVENTRKEVHGCIIASVKLFYPDGREAITLHPKAATGGECKISYEEMHRINMHMQEAAHREKALKAKLYNIQNVLDATRKNSTLCWQSLVAEDQLLSRIHALEKKLQIMEKNTPESVLRNEVFKLMDDKSSCQLTAKEALRKVYQERCDAMQMLAKMETAYNTAEIECKMLREQVQATKQSLKDLNTKFEQIEGEFRSYRDEADQKHEEAKVQAEKELMEVGKKLQASEIHCENLKRKIIELETKRMLLDDDDVGDIEEVIQEQLEKQAIAKLDDAIGAMDFGDDDDEDDDDENDGEAKEVADVSKSNKAEQQAKNTKTNSLENIKISGNKRLPKKSTQMIQRWLQNSDLNKNENVIKAICQELDSSDEQDNGGNIALNTTNDSHESKYTRFFNILEMIQNNLTILEKSFSAKKGEILEKARKAGKANVNDKLGEDGSVKVEDDDENEDDSDDSEDDAQVERNLTTDKNYCLLKNSVDALREACNDILKEKDGKGSSNNSSPIDEHKVKTTKVSLKQAELELENPDDVDELESQASTNQDSLTSNYTVKVASKNQQLIEELQRLKKKYEQLEIDSQNTLEILQIECDHHKDKIAEMQKTILLLKKHDKHHEEGEKDDKQVEKPETNNKPEDKESLPSLNPTTEDLINEEEISAEIEAINSDLVQREEELIAYKERLEQTQTDNVQLRQEIAQLRALNGEGALAMASSSRTKAIIIQRVMPVGVVLIAFICYILRSSFSV